MHMSNMDNSYPTPWIRATSVMTNTRLSNSTPQAFLFHKVCFPLLTFRHHEIAPLRLNRPQKLRQSSSSISSLSNFYNCFTPLGRKTPSFNLLTHSHSRLGKREWKKIAENWETTFFVSHTPVTYSYPSQLSEMTTRPWRTPTMRTSHS